MLPPPPAPRPAPRARPGESPCALKPSPPTAVTPSLSRVASTDAHLGLPAGLQHLQAGHRHLQPGSLGPEPGQRVPGAVEANVPQGERRLTRDTRADDARACLSVCTAGLLWKAQRSGVLNLWPGPALLASRRASLSLSVASFKAPSVYAFPNPLILVLCISEDKHLVTPFLSSLELGSESKGYRHVNKEQH